MLRVEKILCPVDFTEFSDRAYDYAYSLALHYEAKLFVLHVAEPLMKLYSGYLSSGAIEEIFANQANYAQEQIRNLIERRDRSGVTPEVVLQRGAAADAILGFAASDSMDVIVMGTHGRRGFDRLVLGSVTERVLRKSTAPVLAVHDPVRDFIDSADREQPVNIRRILFCTDFSDNSPRALEYALSLGGQYQAEVTLLHVIEGSDGNADSNAHNEIVQRLEQAIPSEARRWSTVNPAVRTGTAYEQILQHANETKTGLIVMGVRGRNAIDLAVFGSTTYRVIQLGPCPVLTVRT